MTDSLHLGFGAVSLEDTVKQTGMCETRGQGASAIDRLDVIMCFAQETEDVM